MPVDHNRQLPVAPERLDGVANLLWPGFTFGRLSRHNQLEVVKIALQAEQVEQMQHMSFFLEGIHIIQTSSFR